jgi:hypothetical protein
MSNAQKKLRTSPAFNPLLSPTLQQAIASLYLEGIILDAASITDLELLSSGKISTEEVMKRALARAKSK